MNWIIFLPQDVFGDDAWTLEIEPPVPFTLGVRIKNNGYGTAKELKIDSAQPKIVENEQGLLVGFVIIGTEINGLAVPNSLLIEFGDVPSGDASVGRWIMTCSLSGEFTEFEAEFSHSDELGGELTSLINAVNTHFLIRDVIVDLPGRDNITDFLATDQNSLTVYESDATDAPVINQSANAQLSFIPQTGSKTFYSLSIPDTMGGMYVQVPDPHAGEKKLLSAIRSDGKVIKPENFWLSKTRNADHSWNYFLNLFDANLIGSYTIVFDEPESLPQPPVIQFIPDKSVAEGQATSFLVEASDPDGTIPVLSAAALPAGASFTDNNNGTGLFNWTPQTGQAGTYAITFKASDGVLTDIANPILTICPARDTDCDGMADDWEIANFGDLSRDGTGDFDGDGISDLQEYLLGTNPTEDDHAPTIPQIIFPAEKTHVDNSLPDLMIENSIDPDGDDVTYEFQIFKDPQLTQKVEENLNVEETVTTTSWQVTGSLEENTWYYWRARAFDGTAHSLWVYGSFFINSHNDQPGEFHVSLPSLNSDVDTTTPALEITNSIDPDEDALTYTFEIYSDSGLTIPVASFTDIPEGKNNITSIRMDAPLNDNTQYFWKATATDGKGGISEITSAFFVQTANASPSAPEILSPSQNSEINQQDIIFEATISTDPEGDTLHYVFELDTVPTFDGPLKENSGEIAGDAASAHWQVSGLSDNTAYFWRVKAGDGAAESPWTNGTFYVNTANDPPPIPVVKNPGDKAWVDTLSPELLMAPVLEPDKDTITYRVEIYGDPSVGEALFSEDLPPSQDFYIPQLEDGQPYYWRAQCIDEHGEAGEWSTVSYFFVKDDGINDPPTLTFIAPSESLLTNDTEIEIQWTDTDPDSNARISLYYDTDNGGEDGIIITENLEEDLDGSNDSYLWDVSALEGDYYVYAVVSDEASLVTVYSQNIRIDRTAATVTANVAPGTYGGPQFVSLSADETADIFYTSDGTAPSLDSTIYNGAIEVSETLTLTAISVDAAGNVSNPVSFDYVIEEKVSVHVTTDAGQPMAGLRVYAFTESGAYTGNYSTTDDQGMAVFDPAAFSDGNYQFRIDFLGHRFWTGILAFPSHYGISRIIEMETVSLSVDAVAADTGSVRVYLFSEAGSYLKVYAVTDANGNVSFELPAGVSFKFRADVLGYQYFSPATLIDGENANIVSVDVGGGVFSITLQEDAETPLEAVRVYLFSESGSYLNLNQYSAVDGTVAFNVSEGTFKVRADYLGYQFWSNPAAITDNIQIDLTIPHTDVTVSLNGTYQGTDTPLENIKTYLFTPSGSYQNLYKYTDALGTVRFHLPDRAYKVRADLLGYQFWTDEFTGMDIDLDVPMADAKVLVTRDGQPVSGVTTYLFSIGGSYLNQSLTTGADGTISYRLPAQNYKFRGDCLGDNYWSNDTPLSADQINPVEINTGGGRFELTVLKGESQPIEGVTCYLFNSSGAYLNVSAITSSEGYVSFDLANGEYQIRVDHLGYQFWTPVYQVPQALSDDFTIAHNDMEILVNGVFLSDVDPIPDIKTYLFTSSGAYLNQYQTTDASGKGYFSLPDRVYNIRADILGYHYWLEDISTSNSILDIPMADTQVTISGAGQGIEGLKTYVFSETGSYLNLYQNTDAQGQTVFRLPANTYDFRVDFQGSQFWADNMDLVQDVVNAVDINTGGGEFLLTVLKNATDPLPNTRCYLFNESGSYLNLYENTSSEGVVTFNLASGNYKIRIDHLGYQFWTPVFTVPDTLSEVFVMGCQDFTVTIQGLYQTTSPLEGIKAYLFKPPSSYQNQYETTDAQGQVVFNLPDQPYTIRADYLGYQFWTDTFQYQDNALTINQGLANVRVHRSGVNVPDARVYLFTESGAYQNWYEDTDTEGICEFVLPDRAYKFRADEGGDQVYSATITIQAGLVSNVEIDLDE